MGLGSMASGIRLGSGLSGILDFMFQGFRVGLCMGNLGGLGIHARS